MYNPIPDYIKKQTHRNRMYIAGGCIISYFFSFIINVFIFPESFANLFLMIPLIGLGFLGLYVCVIIGKHEKETNCTDKNRVYTVVGFALSYLAFNIGLMSIYPESYNFGIISIIIKIGLGVLGVYICLTINKNEKKIKL